MIAGRRHPRDVWRRRIRVVLPADAVGVRGRHTGSVNQALADRWRVGVAALRRSGPPTPPLSRWAWIADVALALVLAALTVYAATRPTNAGALVVFPQPASPPPLVYKDLSPNPVHPGHALLVALAALPLIVRRRFPLLAFWAVLLATLVFHAERQADSNTVAALTLICCLIAAYSAVTYSPYRVRAIISLGIGSVLLAIRHDTTIPDVAAGYLPLLLLLAIGLAANTVHVWRQRVAALEAEREEATAHAVAAERARIARELHDVVTHNVAVMVVQAGAARTVLDTAPDRAREAMLAVEAGGRAALADLRHVMGLLTMGGNQPLLGEPAGVEPPGDSRADHVPPSRDDIAPAPGGATPLPDDLAPQPGLDQLPALVGRVRATGVPVEIAVTGTPVPLPSGADLTAYRVVQEGLTNALKHAAGSNVRVGVDYTDDEVRIVVSDTGGARTGGEHAGTGRGLAGLRERLALFGGTLQATPRPVGGFRVTAAIPLPSGAPPVPAATTPVDAT
jgi:signal transduction histidine kinase